jgi:ureidoacrylate peracid hydrolase
VDDLRSLIDRKDIVLHKDRYSAFYQTNLDLLLRDKGVDTLLFAGVTTNICVESTIRDAYSHDYYPILLSDCTATFSTQLQACAEEVIGLCFGGVTTSSEIMNLLTS